MSIYRSKLNFYRHNSLIEVHNSSRTQMYVMFTIHFFILSVARLRVWVDLYSVVASLYSSNPGFRLCDLTLWIHRERCMHILDMMFNTREHFPQCGRIYLIKSSVLSHIYHTYSESFQHTVCLGVLQTDAQVVPPLLHFWQPLKMSLLPPVINTCHFKQNSEICVIKTHLRLPPATTDVNNSNSWRIMILRK